jgi:hypothetical protein
MNLWEPCVDRGVGGDQPVDVCEAEVAADGVHHRDDRGVPQPAVAELSDVELDVRALRDVWS